MPDVLSRLVAAQCGVLTRGQLGEVGVTKSMIRAAVDARRWQVFGRYVVVLDNSPLTEAQRRWIAVLFAGKPAAIAGLSACAVAGLKGFESDRTEIVVAHATHVAPPNWVKIHESRRFSAADINTAGSVPRTRTARSLVDAATWSPFPRRACAILCAGVQQRLTTPAQLAAELAVAGPVRHAAIMRAIVGDISGGGHTLAEIALGPLAARAGLPPPRRQALRREPNGKVRYLDAEFDLPDGTVLAVEIDGSVHLAPEIAWDDHARANEVVIGGSPLLRFASITVRLEPVKVVDQLVRMRRAHRA